MEKNKESYVKGLKVVIAKPSNGIDIYALMKEAREEGLLEGRPTAKQLQSFYFGPLVGQLTSPIHRWYLARRGRGYLGYLHAVFVPSAYDGNIEYVYIDSFFVVKKRRKMGVGRKLLDELKKQADNLGVRTLRLQGTKEEIEYFKKGAEAQEIKTLLEIKL